MYRFSRNPMYVAYFICFMGMALLVQSLVLTVDEIIDGYLKHITDVKPITARQCIKLLPMIAKDKPELKEDILSALHRADVSFYEDSMRPLVYKDIQKALKEIQKL